MPNPMVAPDGGDRGRHSGRGPDSLATEVPRPRGQIAVELPGWDLLPPAEFVRRHRNGP